MYALYHLLLLHVYELSYLLTLPSDEALHSLCVPLRLAHECLYASDIGVRLVSRTVDLIKSILVLIHYLICSLPNYNTMMISFLLEILDRVFLLMLVYTLHAHQLLTSETILLIVCVRVLPADEGVHRLRVVFEPRIGVPAHPRLLI